LIITAIVTFTANAAPRTEPGDQCAYCGDEVVSGLSAESAFSASCPPAIFQRDHPP